MIAILSRIPLKWWLAIGAVSLVVILYAGYRYQSARADRAVAESRQAKATTEALDKVATQTPVIRAEQAEKERAVDAIQGSDTRLPDGYGRELERVRRGERDRNS